MAVVLDALSSYIGNMLTEMAKDEVHMLLGVSGEMDKMGAKLGDLKKFLADADRRNITDQTVQTWVRLLRDAMYDATDILDLCQLKAMERGGQPSLDSPLQCLNPLLFCLRNPLFAHDIGSRIKKLNKRLDDIKERSAVLGFVNLGSYEDHGSAKLASSRLAARETSGQLNNLAVVGEKIETDTRKLVKMLTQERDMHEEDVMVLAIVGVSGVGKTTLAQKIFNDETIKRQFAKKIWLSVNQGFDPAELLRRAIIEAGGDPHVAGNAKATLQRTLEDTLRGHKTFLVLDDVWNHQAWEDVLKTPIVNAAARGSCVLVTTRHDTVARGMKAMEPYHHVGRLSPQDAWLLLKKQVVRNEKDGPQIDMLRDIGNQIIANFDYLPLAVKVAGGLLLKKNKTREDWEKVLRDSIRSESELSDELNYATYLSYQDLHPSLKQCFLHFSLLPKENTSFGSGNIIGMWISEGFVHGNPNELEDLGREYYDELILRNLIEPNPKFINQHICSMHDVVRSFAHYVARDEALVAHNTELDIVSKLSSQNFFRLSLKTEETESNQLKWSSLEKQKSLRTLISVGPIKIKPSDSFATFSCLRTLHLEGADADALVGSLHQLKHLRYLCLKSSNLSGLPENIGKLKLLRHISLRGCRLVTKIPVSTAKLQQLRFLNLDGTSLNSIPRKFGALTNLRRLSGFPAYMDGDWCSLEELGPLSQLRKLNIFRIENVSSASFAAKARLGEKVCLTWLTLECTSRLGHDHDGNQFISEEEQRQIKDVFEEFCPPACLHTLWIEGYFGQKLPGWMASTAPAPLNNLRFLAMKKLPCCTDLPDGLCKLPCLEILNIAKAPAIKRVGREFLQPVRHSSSFRRLRKLVFDRMVEWQVWEWEENMQAMPLLEELAVAACKLRRVPPGLSSHAKALNKLALYEVQHLDFLENFTSVTELEVSGCLDLQRISNFTSLQKLVVSMCPRLKTLDGVPPLESLGLEDYYMQTLPGYLHTLNPRHLLVYCSFPLLGFIAAGDSGPEWDKLSHIQHLEAYAPGWNYLQQWYVLYTKDPFSLQTNMSAELPPEL